MIFANVRAKNAIADADPETLRISVDTKATVNVGDFSRGGKSRGRTAVAAWDHDMHPKEKLIPGGILESVSGKSFLEVPLSQRPFADNNRTSRTSNNEPCSDG